MIARVLVFTVVSFSLGAACIRFVNRRSVAERRRERWIKLGGYFAVVHAVLACAWLGRNALGTLLLMVTVAGGRELVRAEQGSGNLASFPSLATLGSYTLVAAALVAFAFSSAPSFTVYVYLIVASFDGFSQVVGETAGRHRLVPRVSPNKTVEGALGGFLAAMATGFALRPLTQLDWRNALTTSALIGAAALAGDLSASWVKRRSRIKDFGTLLPAQGGVLDRFDSFLFAGAATQLFVRIWR